MALPSTEIATTAGRTLSNISAKDGACSCGLFEKNGRLISACACIGKLAMPRPKIAADKMDFLNVFIMFPVYVCVVQNQAMPLGEPSAFACVDKTDSF